MERLYSPILFLVFMLLPFLLYFTQWPYWWGLQLVLQLLICLIGLFVAGWRSVALLSLVLLLAFNIRWFHFDSQLPDSCRRQIDHLSGIAEVDRNDVSGNLRIMRVELWCQKEFIRWPVAELALSDNRPATPGWFRNGDRIGIRNVSISVRNAFLLDIRPTVRLRVTNISHQFGVLNRSPLLIYIQKKARYFLTGFPYAIYKALVTADRSSLTDVWRQRFSELGITHLFAISGMHIGILYLWFSFTLRYLISFPGHWTERGNGVLLTDLLSIVAIFFILRGIGMPISAKRAFIMLAWWGLMRHFLGWQPLWFILCGTAVIILLDFPVAIGQISFQLSFLSVAGIILILPHLPQRQLQDSFLRRLFKTLAASLAISLWLFILTMPLIGILTRQVSLIAPLNNVFHIFYLSFIFLPASLLVAILTFLGYPLGGLPIDLHLYSFLNFLGKLWEQLLVLNDRLNGLFMVGRPDFLKPLPVLAWIFLLGTPFLIRWRRSKK